MIETLKKYAIYIGTTFLSLLTLLFLNNRRKEAEAKIENFNYDITNAVTIEKLAQANRELQAAISVSEVEKNRKLTREEMLVFLKKYEKKDD